MRVSVANGYPFDPLVARHHWQALDPFVTFFVFRRRFMSFGSTHSASPSRSSVSACNYPMSASRVTRSLLQKMVGGFGFIHATGG